MRIGEGVHPLSLITWNVRYFSHGLKGLRATKAGIRRAADAVAQARPDLLALQEVEQTSLRGGIRAPQLARFVDALHAASDAHGHGQRWTALYFPAHHYRLPRGPALTTAGLAILVARPLRVVDHNATEPDEITHVRLPRLARYKQRRIAAWARIDTPGGPLDLVNTHLSLPAFFESGPDLPSAMGHGSNQLHEAHALLEVVDRRTAGPTVVVGDFNSAPDSPVHRVLTGRGLVDAFAHTVSAERAAARATAHFGPRSMHIDHVFTTPDLRWLGFEPDHGRADRFHGLSDHRPKWGHLAVGAPGEPAPV